MKYTIPDYYRDFHCIASECPATCCAGWQIVIDQKTLRKYRRFPGSFGSRLANSIDWKEGAFKQYGKRCAFLNEENLCDIYTEAGVDMLCKTCRKYPRHIEEFENERELSLSISCPVAAQMILGRKKKVTFLEKTDSLQEKEDESFDFFLYSALQDCRSVMIQMMQDRSIQAEMRMAMVLALAHDVQNRIDSRRIFEIEELLKRYTKKGASGKLQEKLYQFAGKKDTDGQMGRKKSLLCLLDQLEVLDPAWPEFLKSSRSALYQDGKDGYKNKLCMAYGRWTEPEQAGIKGEQRWTGPEQAEVKVEQGWTGLEYEQLMVYFLFTYFCGAVYDGDVLSKVKMSVVSTVVIRELEVARQVRSERPISLQERAQIAWRFSRELEHSDLNLNKMEELMGTEPSASFEELLYCLIGSFVGPLM